MKARIYNCPELNPDKIYEVLWYTKYNIGCDKDVHIEVQENNVLKSIKVAYQNIVWLESEDNICQ